MNFCSDCGGLVTQVVPEGDNLKRFVCDDCGVIHYQNPRMVVGCIPEYQGRILLCLRAIEPRKGYWTFPAGFLEVGETLEEGAARESLEEACARVEIGSLISVVNVTHAQQVHFAFRSRLKDGEFAVGHETTEAGLFNRTDVPWDKIAFPSVTHALRAYFSDLDEGQETVHIASVGPIPRDR